MMVLINSQQQQTQLFNVLTEKLNKKYESMKKV